MGLYEDLFDFNGNGKVDFDDDYSLMQMTNQNKHSDSGKSKSKSDDGCYVATCVYGSYDCPEVWTLRRFRDNYLAKSAPGRLFIRAYYAVSPTVVRWFGSQGWFKRFWRGMLDKLVMKLKSKGVESSPYKDRNWRQS